MLKIIDIIDEEKVLEYLSSNFKDETTSKTKDIVPEYGEIRKFLIKIISNI